MTDQRITDMIKRSIKSNPALPSAVTRSIIEVDRRDQLSHLRDVRIYLSQILDREQQSTAIGKVWGFLGKNGFSVPDSRSDSTTISDIGSVFYTARPNELDFKGLVTVRCRSCTIADEVLSACHCGFGHTINYVIKITVNDHAKSYFEDRYKPAENALGQTVESPKILHPYYVIVEMRHQPKTIKKVAETITDYLMENDPGPDGEDNEIKTEITQSGRGFHKTHIIKIFCHNLNEIKAIADLLRGAPWLVALGLIKVYLWKPMGEK